MLRAGGACKCRRHTYIASIYAVRLQSHVCVCVRVARSREEHIIPLCVGVHIDCFWQSDTFRSIPFITVCILYTIVYRAFCNTKRLNVLISSQMIYGRLMCA